MSTPSGDPPPSPIPGLAAQFKRREVPLNIVGRTDAGVAILNPACARLRDGTLQLYPRMVAPGNVSRIGSFRTHERRDGTLDMEQTGVALAPTAPYELRDGEAGYGCEDPRVTYIRDLDLYAMAYVAVGPRGPEVAVAISHDGLAWDRLGLVQFGQSEAPFADKDAAFFPEAVLSPRGERSIAFYHRPTLVTVVGEGQSAIDFLRALPPEEREGIAIGYVPLDAVRRDISNLCNVSETHRLSMPSANWGAIKVGAGTPPVRISEGWLAVIHGVDELEHPDGTALLRYCAGLIVQNAERIESVIYRSPEPLFVPERPGELHGTVGHVVFPTAIDVRADRIYDIYYGMADDMIGRGRLTL